MTIFTGTIIECSLMLWLSSPGGRIVLERYWARCEVLSVDRHIVDTGAPQSLYVDCTKSLQWLDTNHVAKKRPITVFLGEDRCVE